MIARKQPQNKKRATNGRPYKRISAENLFSLPTCVIMGLHRRAGACSRRKNHAHPNRLNTALHLNRTHVTNKRPLRVQWSFVLVQIGGEATDARISKQPPPLRFLGGDSCNRAEPREARRWSRIHHPPPNKRPLLLGSFS